MNQDSETAPCPFCPGNESLTTPEVLAVRPPHLPANGPGWKLRVVPNLFPALEPGGNLQPAREGVFEKREGIGRHELVIETRDHQADLDTLSADQMGRVIRVLWSRLDSLEEDPATAYVLIFRNWGRGSGASLAHPHAQILAMPILPDTVATEVVRSVAYLRRTGHSLGQDMVKMERESGVRLVSENEQFLVVTPYAAAYPFEVALYPREQSSSFRDLTEADIPRLGALLQDVIARMKQVLHAPAYNIVLHTAPNPRSPETAALADPGDIEAAYHWHLEIVPRLPRVDGFEWGTGMFVNTTPPEEAARILREVVGK